MLIVIMKIINNLNSIVFIVEESLLNYRIKLGHKKKSRMIFFRNYRQLVVKNFLDLTNFNGCTYLLL